MNVTRYVQATAYEAPNHFDMRCVRLQGREAGPASVLLAMPFDPPGAG